MAGTVGFWSLLPPHPCVHHGEVKVRRRVIVVVFDGAQSLDVTGPVEVLTRGGQLARSPYEIELVAAPAGTITTSSGLRLQVGAVSRVRGPVDTLVVAGGDGTSAALDDAGLLRGIARLAARARRVTSVCTGAFLLAEVGLLDGRRATTHWDSCATMAARYPLVQVDPEPIFVRDGIVATSAGVTAGMDLALALVEEDHGAAIALATARRLVMYVRRPGGQAQFSAPLRAQEASLRTSIADVQRWVRQHPDADCSVVSLARRAAMSPRHFARAFVADAGTTPARWVEGARVDHARLLLESSDLTTDAVASASGFRSAETLRRAFLRQVRVPPSEYRKRFRKEPA